MTAASKWRTYRVTIDGCWKGEMIAAKSRSQAIINVWRCDAFGDISFREFLKRYRPRARVVRDLHKHNDGYAYVRRAYNVDPTVGQRVRLKNEGDWSGREGVVVYPGPRTAHVHVAFDGLNHPLSVHPSNVDLIPPTEENSDEQSKEQSQA